MNTSKLITFFAIALISTGLILSGCSGEQAHDDHEGHEHADDHEGHEHHDDHADHEHQADGDGIQVGEYMLMPVSKSTAFPKAELRLLTPEKGVALKAGPNEFEYEVGNYELGAQTGGDMSGHCANSGKGQHIHWIVNNSPYKAHYENIFTEDLPDGKHLLLSFLSRSYHESIKNGTAHTIRQLNVGNVEGQKDYDLTKPMLFYSRPKGTYKGNDTEHLLLDFFLINTKIGADGNKVKVTINGQSAMLDKWVPYLITGLPMGENTVQIELVDGSGKPIPGPFNNSGPRKIMLEKAPTDA